MEENKKKEINKADENKRRIKKPKHFSPEGFSGKKLKKETKGITKKNLVASKPTKVLTERNVAEATGKSCDQIPSTSGVRNSKTRKVSKKQQKTVNLHKDISETMKSSIMSISDVSDASPAINKNYNHARAQDINILKNLNASIDVHNKADESSNNTAGQVVQNTDSSASIKQDQEREKYEKLHNNNKNVEEDKLNELSDNESLEEDESEETSGENGGSDNSTENDDDREDELEIERPLNDVQNVNNQQPIADNDNDSDEDINDPVNVENQQQPFNFDDNPDANVNDPSNVDDQQQPLNDANDPDADMYISLNHQIYSSDDRHVRLLRDGIYILSNVYLSVTHTARKPTHMIRRLMDGVFKRNDLRNVTLTGRSNTEILHPKAIKAIIDFTKNFKNWKRMPSKTALNRVITLKVNEMKGESNPQQ